MRNFNPARASNVTTVVVSPEVPVMRRVSLPAFLVIVLISALSAAALWQARSDRNLPVAIIPTVSTGVRPVASSTDLETEKYAVYSAVIRNMYLEDGVRLLVIQQVDPCPSPAAENLDEDMRQRMDEYAIREFQELKRETIEDFHARSKQCVPLRKQLDIPIKYTLVSAKDVEALFPKGELDRAWTRFYSKYPNSSGLITFSNVGFNAEMNQALVSTGRGCGGLCGEGYYVLLAKEKGVWYVKSKIMTWVS